MSLGSTGQQGRPDDVAVTNWDTAMPLLTLTTAQTGAENFGPYNVSNYGYLMMSLFAATNPVLCTVQYYTDSTLALACGSLSLNVPLGAYNAWQVHTINLGPYVQFQFTTVNPSDVWTPKMAFTPVNRTMPTSTQISNALMAAFTPNLAAGQTITSLIPNIWAGPFVSYVEGGSQGVDIEFDSFDVLAGWEKYKTFSVAANTTDYRSHVAPLNPTRYSITNHSGAVANTTSYFNLMASFTGST